MIQDKLGKIISKTLVDGIVKKLHQKCKVTSKTSNITQTLPKAPKRARITLPNYRIKICPAQHGRNLALARKNRVISKKIRKSNSSAGSRRQHRTTISNI